MKPFVQQVCEYLITQTDRFTFGQNSATLKVGELNSNVDGVRAIMAPSQQPEMEIPVEYFDVDFWAVNKSTPTAFDDLQEIYDILHQKDDFNFDNWYIEFSHALGQIQDLDRDGQNRKLLKLSIRFIAVNLTS